MLQGSHSVRERVFFICQRVVLEVMQLGKKKPKSEASLHARGLGHAKHTDLRLVLQTGLSGQSANSNSSIIIPYRRRES